MKLDSGVRDTRPHSLFLGFHVRDQRDATVVRQVTQQGIRAIQDLLPAFERLLAPKRGDGRSQFRIVCARALPVRRFSLRHGAERFYLFRGGRLFSRPGDRACRQLLD